MSKIFEFIIELVGWIQIVLSPTLIGFGLGIIVCVFSPDMFGISIGILLTALGLIIGIIYATHVWKKKGTINLLSRLSATPELDNLDDIKPKTEK